MKSIRLLVIGEDSEAEKIQQPLRQAYDEVRYRCCRNLTDFNEALMEDQGDTQGVIFCLQSARLPFNDALTRSQSRDLPVFVLASPQNEAQAARKVIAGAEDYILSDRLIRLVPALARARRQNHLQTQWRKTQMEWSQNEILFKLMLENVKDYAIFMTDVSGKVATWNEGARKILGYQEKEVIGKDAALFFTPEDRKKNEPRKELKNAEKSGRTADERWHIRKDGSRFYASGVVTALRDSQGRLRGFVKIMRDFTENKLTQEKLEATTRQLQALNRAKSEFTSIISHELRTPLSSIKEGIQIVLDGIDGPVTEDQTQTLGIAKENVDRMTRLIGNILDFSKIEAGHLTIHPIKAPIGVLASKTYHLMKRTAAKKGINFNLQDSAGETIIECDPDRIQQVLINLVDNAVKFTDVGGSISMVIASKPEEVTLTIEDTGVGIRPEDQKRIFQMFARSSDQDTILKAEGFGIGLTVCQKIIEAHKGRIEVESRWEQGSRFRIVLPKSMSAFHSTEVSPN